MMMNTSMNVQTNSSEAEALKYQDPIDEIYRSFRHRMEGQLQAMEPYFHEKPEFYAAKVKRNLHSYCLAQDKKHKRKLSTVYQQQT